MGHYKGVNSVTKNARRAKKLRNKIEAIKNSNLTVEEKEKALNCFKKMLVTTTIVVVVIALLLVVAVVMMLFIGGDAGVIFLLLSMAGAVVLLIVYALIARNVMFKDFRIYYDMVDHGFDGLDEHEINKLKPNQSEEALIKKYKAKSFVYTLILALVLGIEFYILGKFELPLDSPVLYIITLVIFFVWYGFYDTCKVEIHRLESGYYKKSYGFRCKKCGTEVFIEFSEIEKYLDAPTNENGIRVIPCQTCNHLVPFYSFDEAYESYKKYVELTK